MTYISHDVVDLVGAVQRETPQCSENAGVVGRKPEGEDEDDEMHAGNVRSSPGPLFSNFWRSSPF